VGVIQDADANSEHILNGSYGPQLEFWCQRWGQLGGFAVCYTSAHVVNILLYHSLYNCTHGQGVWQILSSACPFFLHVPSILNSFLLKHSTGFCIGMVGCCPHLPCSNQWTQFMIVWDEKSLPQSLWRQLGKPKWTMKFSIWSCVGTATANFVKWSWWPKCSGGRSLGHWAFSAGLPSIQSRYATWVLTSGSH